jgi:ComF family protein
MKQHGVRDFARGVVDLIFPNSCLICDCPATDDDHFRHGLCSSCYGAVTGQRLNVCLRCGQNVGPHSSDLEGCVVCRKVTYAFSSVVRLGRYDGRLREAVLRIKTSFGESLAERLGQVFVECRKDRLSSLRSDLVVSIPLHWRRAWWRGYNQAAAIAEQIGKSIGVPVARGCLKRVRHTPQQVQPSAAARRENVRGAFRVAKGANVAGKRILLVDDVMTTGSTASEASRTLRDAGAAEICVAVLARR